MRYADPAVCPSCRGALGSAMRCPVCGLDLTTREAGELWQALLKADSLLDAARATAPATPAPPAPQPTAPPVAPGPPVQQQPPFQPAAPQPPMQSQAPPDPFRHQPMPRPAQTPPPGAPAAPKPLSIDWSVGTVLLTLGAFGLVVAALIFVARSWDTIGLFGKAAILAAATAAVAAVAVWVTRRPLRASSEALWAVTACMVAVDVGGARAEGLAGLDDVAGSWIAVVAGAVFAFGAGGLLVWARRHLEHDSISLGLASVAGIATASTGAALIGSHDNGFWHVFVGLLVCGALGLALRFSGSSLIAIGARVVLAIFFVVAGAFAFVELVSNPTLGEVVGEAHGLPTLLMAAATVGVGVAIPVLRVAAGAVAGLGIAALVITPATQVDTDAVATGEGGLVAASVLAAVGALLLVGGADPWRRGLRLAICVVAIAPLAATAWWATALVAVPTSASSGGWEFGAAPTDAVEDHLLGEPIGLVTTLVLAATLVLIAWFLPRWPELERLPGPRVVAVVAPVALVGVPLALDLSLVALAAVLAVLAAATIAAGRALRTGWALATGMVLAWSAAWFGFVDATVAVWVWPVAAALLAAATLLARLPLQAVAAALLPSLAAGTGAAVCELIDVAAPTGQIVFVLLAAGAAAAVALRQRAGGLTVETVVTVLVLYVLTGWMAAVWTDTNLQASAVLTVAGATAIGLSTLTPVRVPMLVLGVVELVAAYVFLLLAGSVDAIEAYTLPLGVAALAGGWWARRRKPELSTWAAYGAGLALALLPSLPQALAEPTSVRALVLGAAAIALVAVGIRLDWQAPFVAGVVVAGLILLVNIGPYAQAAPRVVIIAVVSTVLVGLGITWEDRVRDGRRLAALVKGMS